MEGADGLQDGRENTHAMRMHVHSTFSEGSRFFLCSQIQHKMFAPPSLAGLCPLHVCSFLAYVGEGAGEAKVTVAMAMDTWPRMDHGTIY